MNIVRRATVALSAERAFDLIERAEDYPAFLPWCTEAVILERSDAHVRARVGFGYPGLSASMLSDVDKQWPSALHVRIDTFPFRRFRGDWQITPLSAQTCSITFTASTGFQDAWWSRLLGIAAGLIADRMVGAFVARARRI